MWTTTKLHETTLFHFVARDGGKISLRADYIIGFKEITDGETVIFLSTGQEIFLQNKYDAVLAAVTKSTTKERT